MKVIHLKKENMMETGASSIHKQLRTNLEDYIKSQYFGKTPLLLSALEEHIDDERHHAKRHGRKPQRQYIWHTGNHRSAKSTFGNTHNAKGINAQAAHKPKPSFHHIRLFHLSASLYCAASFSNSFISCTRS